MSEITTLVVFVGGLVLFVLLGMRVAMIFLMLNLVLATVIIGFPAGGLQMVGNMVPTASSFVLMPIPLFVFMGELMYHSGVANRALDGISKWFGRVPGRLSLITMAAGVNFSVLSGSPVATTSMLGTMLVPEMRRRRYSTEMSVGAVLAAGGLAMVIPPSALTVLVGSIGRISIGRLLLAGLIPGLLLGVLAMGYIVVRCWLNPALAPPYDVEGATWGGRLRALFLDILPLGSVLVLLMWLIIEGLATPTEAAAVGAMGTVVLIGLYRGLSFGVMRSALIGTIRLSGAILLIIGAAGGYSQLLAYSGALRGLLDMVRGLETSPLLIVVVMLLVLAMLGSPLENISIMMITLPVFVPLVTGLGLDPIWFGILFLIMLDIAQLTPPMGLALYVMNSVTPSDVTFPMIIKAGLPFILIDVVAIILLFIWPQLATWLPTLAFGPR